MKLLETINEDLKQAMRQKQELELSALRMLLSALKNKAISMGVGTVLSDEEVVAVISSEVKKRKDSIELYEKGGRQDLADHEKQEIEILQKYMPEQLGEEQIESAVREVVAGMGEVGMSDFGKVMGQSMARLKGQANGDQVGAIVKKVLSK